jgi:hypothetical protein
VFHVVECSNSLLTVWSCIMLKVSVVVCLFFVNSSLNATENEGGQPNLAGTVGQRLIRAAEALEKRIKSKQELAGHHQKNNMWLCVLERFQILLIGQKKTLMKGIR